MTYPLLIFRALPPPHFFPELSNDICSCTAVHVGLWHEAAGMEPGMEWADPVSLAGCRYRGCNSSIKPWPGVEREELSPAAFPSRNSGRCGLRSSPGSPAAGCSLVPAMEQEFSCFLEPLGIVWETPEPHTNPSPIAPVQWWWLSPGLR